jgi:hypothetical protein
MKRYLEEIGTLLLRLLDPQAPSEVADPGDDDFHRDDRDDYVYVTLELTDRIGPDIDISLHEKVCLIRIRR